MNNSINTTMGYKEWAMLFILSVLWGGSFFFVEVIIAELPTLTTVFFRVFIAAITLWFIVWILGLKRPQGWRCWLSFLIMGALNNVIPFSLIVWGQIYIASGLASILNATTPLFTVIVASWFLHDEHPTFKKIIGVLIGFAGVILMIGPSALEELGSDVLAQFAVLAAAFFYALAGVYGRRFKAMEIHPIVAAAGQVSGSSLILMPIVFFIDRPFDLVFPSTYAVLSLLGLAVLSTAIAYILFFRILASSGATNLLLATFLVPVTSILLGTMILGETLEFIHIIGMGMIAVGLSAIDGRLWTR